MLEMLLSVAIIGILAGMGAVVMRSFQLNDNVSVAASIAGQAMRQAQVRSMSGDGDSTWGVFIQEGEIIIFKGDSYAGRDADYDESFSINTALVVSGTSEIVFESVTGLPSTTTVITFIAPNNVQATTTINSAGLTSF
ncbi:hypothetical protein KJ766_01870 [Patescibacteria group bacterium]|nr:hypothetical protein [Patescibacteria group bacterium]